MFAITAAFAAFLISLLIIASMVYAINEQNKQMAELVKKNNLLMAELKAAENMAGLKADFEEVLYDN